MKKPTIGKDVFIADGARIMGDVTLGEQVGVWYNAVIRGDEAPIVIGDRTNVQDNVVMHGMEGVATIVGSEVTIGHGAIVHGCTVKDHTLIGMGSIILDHAVVGSNCIVGAGALVPGGMVVPDGSLVVGVPAKVVRQLTEKEIEHLTVSADIYVQARDWHREG